MITWQASLLDADTHDVIDSTVFRAEDRSDALLAAWHHFMDKGHLPADHGRNYVDLRQLKRRH